MLCVLHHPMDAETHDYALQTNLGLTTVQRFQVGQPSPKSHPAVPLCFTALAACSKPPAKQV